VTLDPKFKANPKSLYYKTAPRAHIGYLVGYRASNIYRVWIPALHRVITTRDVTFDENTYFHPDNEGLRTPIETYQHIAEELQLPELPPLTQIIPDPSAVLDEDDTAGGGTHVPATGAQSGVTETPLEPDSLFLAGKSPDLTPSSFQELNIPRPTPESTDIRNARNPAITAIEDGNAAAAVGNCIKIASEPVNQSLQASLEIHGDRPPSQPSDEPQRSAPENDNSPQSKLLRNHDRRPRRTRRELYGSVAIRRSTRIQTTL
jgi:hypothetical protein